MSMDDVPLTSAVAEKNKSTDVEAAVRQSKASSVYSAKDFVTFIYEGEVFPGQIVTVEEEGCVITSMIGNGFIGDGQRAKMSCFILSRTLEAKYLHQS